MLDLDVNYVALALAVITVTCSGVEASRAELGDEKINAMGDVVRA
jgi:hypothetical protein